MNLRWQETKESWGIYPKEIDMIFRQQRSQLPFLIIDSQVQIDHLNEFHE